MALVSVKIFSMHCENDSFGGQAMRVENVKLGVVFEKFTIAIPVPRRLVSTPITTPRNDRIGEVFGILRFFLGNL
jgi:hypothetical protein